MDRATLYRHLFRLVPPPLRHGLARHAAPGVGVFPVPLHDGGAILLDRMDRSVMLRRLFWQGIEGHEPLVARLVHLLAREAATVLVVGAFVGTYALLAAAANPRARVHSVEPLPENAALHRHLVALNRLEERIEVHELAVGRAEGTVAFHRPLDRRGRLVDIGSLQDRSAPGRRFAGRPFETVEVRALPLDRLWQRIGRPQVDLVKLDVEEAEEEVLASGAAMLAACRPDLVIEVILDSPDIAAAGARLAALGYRFFDLAGDGLVPLPALAAPPARAAGGDRRVGKRRGGLTDRLGSCRDDDAIARLSQALRTTRPPSPWSARRGAA